MSKVHTTCRIDPSIHFALEAEAKTSGETRTAIIEAALSRYLDCDTRPSPDERVTGKTENIMGVAVSEPKDLPVSQGVTQESVSRDTDGREQELYDDVMERARRCGWPRIEYDWDKVIGEGRVAWRHVENMNVSDLFRISIELRLLQVD